MERILIVETTLPEEILKELKKKTGIETTKGALAEAVIHFIECYKANENQNFENSKNKSRKKKKSETSYITCRDCKHCEIRLGYWICRAGKKKLYPLEGLNLKGMNKCTYFEKK